MGRHLPWIVAGILLLTSTAVQAAYLNPRGLGQVLVYPYYTANGNNATLLSIFNSTDRGKALKVRFHEGYDGREVLDFNVYLGPHDTWVGGITNRLPGADSPASLITNDGSCTVPVFAQLPGAATGTRYVDFTDANYAGSVLADGTTGNADGGPTDPGRTREGHFDVFEMGEVTDATQASLRAISAANDGAPADCAQIAAAWASGGYWVDDPTTDLAPPAGGIYGSEAVVDVGQGTFFTAVPEAIDGFSTSVQHTPPRAMTPDLHTASKSANGTVAAFVPVEGRMIELDYTNPVDAISALFMADALYNEFNLSAALGALTDWIVTSPTKRYYVDPAYIGEAIGAAASQPFERPFLAELVRGSNDGVYGGYSSFPYACVQVAPTAYDRSGAGYPMAVRTPNGLLPSTELTPCLETSVLTFSSQVVPGHFEDFDRQPVSALGSNLTNGSDPYGVIYADGGLTPDNPALAEGTLRLDLIHDINGNVVAAHRLSAAANGDVLLGLPVLGFAAENYVNANVAPGVLGNYSGAYRHRTSVACVHATIPQNACL